MVFSGVIYKLLTIVVINYIKVSNYCYQPHSRPLHFEGAVYIKDAIFGLRSPTLCSLIGLGHKLANEKRTFLGCNSKMTTVNPRLTTI